MEKRWVYKSLPPGDKIKELSSSINVNPTLAALLMQRGISSFEQARDFFRPGLIELHDPCLMQDMEKAVDRLVLAIEKGERILIYGDYDVDGTTAVSLVFGFLQEKYPNIDYYIPDRYSEGYGVSAKGIDYANEEKITLIISLDCGIKASGNIKYAGSLGIDFIVCDHHTPDDELPPAYAVLDPKRKDCPYPYKELSGCGVGFKYMQALSQRMGWPEEELFSWLDLVAISIAADIVPITGENRILTFYGLQKINTSPRPGVKALIDLAVLKKEVDVSNIVFGLAPRINAAGRIAHARAAVQLLLSKTEQEALYFGVKVNEKNVLRKDFDLNITEEALKMIESSEELRNARSTVLFKEDWHKGVIGIVASRCIEKYYRPTIILTQSNDCATGSARSVPGFDVYEAISRCSDLLEQFGGHMYAAGLTMQVDKIPEFRERFEKVVSDLLTEEHLTPVIEVDMKLDLNQVNDKMLRIIRQMGPFGPGNMQPLSVHDGTLADL